jgi:hypothetical protein
MLVNGRVPVPETTRTHTATPVSVVDRSTRNE